VDGLTEGEEQDGAHAPIVATPGAEAKVPWTSLGDEAFGCLDETFGHATPESSTLPHDPVT
jgi:hypothetical protein